MKIISAILIGYAFGCIQSAYLISKLFGKMDIREHGSGNAGASNITEIMGLKYGIAVGLIDILKGVFAVLVVGWIYPANPELPYLAGIMAIIGHCFPFYMKFRGGKGVATLIGMAFGLDWKLGLLFVLLVAVPALVSDHVSVGSLTVYVALPVATYFMGYNTIIVSIGFLMTLLGFYVHRSNIQRLRNHTEGRISVVLKKKR